MINCGFLCDMEMMAEEQQEVKRRLPVGGVWSLPLCPAGLTLVFLHRVCGLFVVERWWRPSWCSFDFLCVVCCQLFMTPCCFDDGEKGKRLLVASVCDLRPLIGSHAAFLRWFSSSINEMY